MPKVISKQDQMILKYLKTIKLPGYWRILLWLDAQGGSLVIPRQLSRRHYGVSWRDVQHLEDLGYIVVGRRNYDAIVELTVMGKDQVKRLKEFIGCADEFTITMAGDCAEGCKHEPDIAGCVRKCMERVV